MNNKNDETKTRSYITHILISIVVIIVSPFLHPYSISIDIYGITSQLEFFESFFQSSFFIFLPTAIQYFIISIIFYTIFKAKIIYSLTIPFFAYILDDIYIYIFTEQFFLLNNTNLTLPKIGVIFVALILSTIGALIGKMINKRYFS